jgi:UDP-N-acetylglucosamine 2-epimerase (non-hydrolysing)
MKRGKILIVFGTRPEIVKLAPLIHGLQGSSLKDDVVLVTTWQHKELQDKQLKFWKIKPDYFLPELQHTSLTRLLANTLVGLQDILDQSESVEYIVVQGDTNTALACAQLAFLNKKKLIHIEAGLRSFDLQNPFPEEFNRIIASRVAYFHFSPTELAKQNLLAEGVDPSSIMVNGNTVIDSLRMVMKNNDFMSVKKDQVLVTMHRRENIDSNYLTLVSIVKELAIKHPQVKFVWVMHPNSSINISNAIIDFPNIELKEPMPYDEFVGMYMSTKMVITDSGGVVEEATELGIPVVVFRQTTERVEPLEVNYPMLISLDHERVKQFFNEWVDKSNRQTFSYGDGKASETIIRWLESQIEQPFNSMATDLIKTVHK